MVSLDSDLVIGEFARVNEQLLGKRLDAAGLSTFTAPNISFPARPLLVIIEMAPAPATIKQRSAASA